MANYHQSLRIDTTGLPLEWIDYRDATKLYAVEQVVYTPREKQNIFKIK
jgi:hypothetical protein